jgi:serine/threonine protein kinase
MCSQEYNKTLVIDIMTKAYHLSGVTLPGGWLLKDMYTKSAGATGGYFSVQYKAEREGKEYFVKVIDVEKALRRVDVMEFAKELQRQMEAFTYEKDLLEKCRDRSLSKVVRVIDASMIPIDSQNVYPIPFLVFEKADGNIREYISFQNAVDFAWKLKSLHDIATGIEQLHSIEVIHQDLKPSNILQFEKESKIADLGRSKTFSQNGMYDKMLIAGDRTYAPLEIFDEFAFLRPVEWLDMNLAMDSYELGNLMTFYFTGMNMTAMLIERLKKIGIAVGSTQHEMRSYLDVCYNDCIETIKAGIEYDEFKEDIGLMIYQLCNPDPNKRNDPKTLKERGSNYILRRYITKLDLLQHKAELMVKGVKKDGTVH